MIVYGISPVLEALRARRVTEVRVADRSDRRVQEVVALAAAQGLPVRHVPSDVLQAQTGGGVHQGVAAEVDEPREWTIDGIVAAARATPLVVVLDGVEDPQNFGAILRAADAAGADGVVVQTRHAAPRSAAAAKASAGALAHARIAPVVNIARALGDLKDLGLWVVGLAGDGGTAYDAVDWTLPSALVLGAEGVGLRRLVRERCDVLAAIPMAGRVESLNVSVAAGVTLFEAVRQRRVAQKGRA